MACDIHAERHLAKAGGSKRKLRGIPTLVTEQGGSGKGGAVARGLHKRSAEDWGKRLAGAWGLASSRLACGKCSIFYGQVYAMSNCLDILCRLASSRSVIRQRDFESVTQMESLTKVAAFGEQTMPGLK